MRLLDLTLLPLFLLPWIVAAVKQEDFKQCHQTSFCRRLRSLADRAPPRSPYSLGAASAAGDGWVFPVSSSLYPEIKFELVVDVLDGGAFRVRMDELDSRTGFQRYNETAKWALLGAPTTVAADLRTAGDVTTITYGAHELVLEHAQLKITQKTDGSERVVINDRNLLHMEHFRRKTEDVAADKHGEHAQAPFSIDRSWFEDDDKDMFEEKWKKWTDSKPKGPEGLSLDISFPSVQHIYGLPEHSSPLSLPSTRGDGARYTEPYRLYNVDIFEYLADSPMALYGAIPLVHAHGAASSVGVFDLVASETWVDVVHAPGGVQTHWVSESGILDLVILPGPRPDDLFEQYAALTGTTALPPHWSTAFHQCRWNYLDETDVLTVDAEFDKADIPLDVTWLDIEYAEEHRYFDWDPKHFPDPVRMLDAVAAKGRKMVAIVDPHIKRTDSFRIYKDAKDLDVLVKRKDGGNFEGWCWTGSSVWVDFFDPKSWEWWTRMFDFSVWKQSAKNLFIWNDMNEPSVFDGPEITMAKDNVHHGGWEHRDVHNLNGMMFHNQTQAALIARESPAKRPFVLSRSFFAGSQRYGAVWTGDNLGDWEHLATETAMMLSNSIAGMSFMGSDVGGFFGNPSLELLVRWTQAGAFMPFFRAHAHIDTKRREPYLYDELIRGLLRDAIRLRYTLLPVWYTAFHEASTRGLPIMRPQYAVFPSDQEGFAIDDQYYVGSSGLLFKPVVDEGATEATVYLADDEPYYDYFTHAIHAAPRRTRAATAAGGRRLTLPVELGTYPLLIRGGSIVSTRERVRRASPLMWQDPFTLTVALGADGGARGELYLDDGESYGYTHGESVRQAFTYAARGKHAVLSSASAFDNAYAQTISHVQVERVVVLGADRPRAVTASGKPVEWTYNAKKKELVVKRPGVKVVDKWEIVVEA
ncbi:glucosidase II [Cryptotrichosporon argae]